MISAELIKKSFLRGLIANNILEGIALPGFFVHYIFSARDCVQNI